MVQPRWGCELSMCWILSPPEAFWVLSILLLQSWPCEKNEEWRMMPQYKHQMTVKVSFLPSHICAYSVLYRKKVSQHSILGWFWRNHLAWIPSFAFFSEILCFRNLVFNRAIKVQDLFYFVYVKDLVKSLVICYDTEAICRSWADSFM